MESVPVGEVGNEGEDEVGTILGCKEVKEKMKADDSKNIVHKEVERKRNEVYYTCNINKNSCESERFNYVIILINFKQSPFCEFLFSFFCIAGKSPIISRDEYLHTISHSCGLIRGIRRKEGRQAG